MSSPPSFGLALPKAKKAKTDNTSTPVFGAAPKSRPIGNKARRKALLAASNDYDRDLDEGDDMDEKEWKVPENEINRRKRKAGDEYDGEEEGDEEEDGNDDTRHDAQRGEEDEVSDEDLEDGEGEEQQVRGQGDKKKVQNNDLDGDTLNKRHRKAEGERLALRSLLDVEQGRRYDAFRVAVIPKPAIKRLNLQIYDQRINDNLAVLLAGMAKIFVADVVELAKDLQAHSKHPTGPLKPYHLRLARNLLEERGVLSGADHTSGGQTARKPKRPLFKR